MDAVFTKPREMIGRFAVVKLWPKLKAAEDENVARLKVTAKALGLECVEITPDGRPLTHLEGPPLTQQDVDFVIHLHFETPKAYDIFSFVALWNPVQFYHDWGYRRYSRHLLTHDDFLSCSATWTDDHVRRMISHDPTRAGPALTMYHSLSEPIYEPTLGDRKIFYAGINWERLGKKKGRHQELLKMLDPTGVLRIHGPKIFQEVDVWEGYQSYAGPIPFDGVSIIQQINRAGIALVFSSDAHKQSELMSNRLFESLAGGALIICDENAFARRHFGDTILYVNASLPVEKVFAAVLKHVDWVQDHPDQALSMARQAQAIFRETFSLDRSLAAIYTGLAERRKYLEGLYTPSDPRRPVDLLFLMPDYSEAVLQRHLASVMTQRHAGCRAVLLVDRRDFELNGLRIRQRIEGTGADLRICPVAFREDDASGETCRRVLFGKVLSDAIDQLPSESWFGVIAPDEELFSEHAQLLAGELERHPESAMAHTDVVYRHLYQGEVYHHLQDELDLVTQEANRPLGFGRFLFRRSAFGEHLHSALPYVDSRAMSLLVAACPSRTRVRRASVVTDIQSSFNIGWELNNPMEMEVMRDYLPDLPRAKEVHATAAPAQANSHVLAPTKLSLKKLSDADRKTMAVDLAHSLPMPSVLRKLLFGSYRVWLHRRK
jgi:hypothetical protein